MKEALVYLLAISAAEVITVTIGPQWGITGHIIIFGVLVVRAAIIGRQTRQQLVLSLSLVPLVRIISLSMPLANIPQVWWYPIIYVPLAVAAFEVVRIQGYRLTQIGFSLKGIPVQLAIALTGIVFGAGEYLILRGEAEATRLVLGQMWLLSGFLLLVSTGFVEELIFRGVLQRSAVSAFGWWGIVYVSLIFAIVHLIHGSIVDIAFVFVIALFFGWVVRRTGSLLGVTLSHGLANIILFLVMPVLF